MTVNAAPFTVISRFTMSGRRPNRRAQNASLRTATGWAPIERLSAGSSRRPTCGLVPSTEKYSPETSCTRPMSSGLGAAAAPSVMSIRTTDDDTHMSADPCTTSRACSKSGYEKRLELPLASSTCAMYSCPGARTGKLLSTTASVTVKIAVARADAERERGHGHEGEPRATPKQSRGEPQVGPEFREDAHMSGLRPPR